MPPDDSQPLRILAVSDMWPEGDRHRGGFVRLAVDAIRALGHTVEVEVVAQSRGRADHFTAIRRVRHRARSGDFDIVHVHFGMTALACRLAGPTPRVISLYGSDINTPWKRLMTQAGWGGTAARIYVSRRLATTAGEPDGIVIPNGVDVERFRPRARSAARNDLGLAPDAKVVLFGGDPRRPVKGHDVFEAVMAEVRRTVPGAQPLILSAPEQPAAVVVAKMAAADVMLFTSRQGSEGSPTVVKEAVAMGLPVVTVDVGDVAEVLAPVAPSWIVPFPPDASRDEPDPRLVAALASGLREALAMSGGRSDGPARARDLSLECAAIRTVEVYRQAMRS